MNEQSDTQSRIVRRDANVETVAAVRKAIKQAWLVDGDKTDVDADRLALAAIAALAQSDAEPVRTAPETCPHCFNEEDCGQIELCSALAKGRQSDAEPVAWQYRIKQGGWGGWHEAAQTKAEALSCIEAQQRWGLVDEYELRPLYTAPPRPDASGLIKALERISKSDVYDMDTLHPERCASVADEALKSFRAADRSGISEK